MPENLLNCAVVGLGLGRHFVDALNRNETVGNITICDASQDRLDEIATTSGKISATHLDLDAMLGSETPDLICLVTPDHLHRPHAEACLSSGAHVLQTKPLATNLDDARAIVRAALKSDRKFMVAHERRFRPSVQRIQSIIDAGDIGDLIHLRIDAISDKRGQFERAPWYASTESGRSAINGTGIHEVDLVRTLVQRPIISVSAFANRLGELDFPKDKTTAALFRFADDIVGQVTVTYEGRAPARKAIDDHLRILGTKGSIFGNKVYREGAEDWETIPVEPGEIVEGIKGCVDSMLQSIATDRPVAVSGEDAFDSLAAACAADTAAANGQVQTPEPLEPA